MEDAPIADAPGTITVVEPDNVPQQQQQNTSRQKRKRSEASHQELIRDVEERDEARAPTVYVNESEMHASEDPEPEPQKSQVQRLLDAKHRRRRQGKHVAHAQLAEDLEDVKRFLSLSDADKEAYLSIYEYDNTTDHIVEGLTKATTLGMRVGMAYSLEPADYDLAEMALDLPEVKDALATVWECVDLDSYTHVRAVKATAAAGHLADTIFSCFMKAYQGVAKAAKMRRTHETILAQRAAGNQSPFDLASNGISEAPHAAKEGAVSGEPTIQTI